MGGGVEERNTEGGGSGGEGDHDLDERSSFFSVYAVSSIVCVHWKRSAIYLSFCQPLLTFALILLHLLHAPRFLACL